MHFLEIIWWFSFIILLGYHLIIFRIRPAKLTSQSWTSFPGVSIVIAVKNGSEKLIENLPVFLSQDYTEYEVILVDDHSDEAEKEKLERAIHAYPQIILHHSHRAQGKKNALTHGIENAKYDWILCTDADCKPAGGSWIRRMIAHTTGSEMVIGYSPYTRKRGLLNQFIRFETAMTAIQYMSWAMMDRPYMGVGRNLMYTRGIFEKSEPYKNETGIPYGDDDLFVQQASVIAKVNVCYEPIAHVFSEAPKTWTGWLRQKHRHLSAAHHYSTAKWWQPAGYGIALILHWFLWPGLLILNLKDWIIFSGLAGLAVRWFIYSKWTRRLGDRDTVIWYPVLEMAYTVYLAGVGFWTLLVKKKTWN